MKPPVIIFHLDSVADVCGTCFHNYDQVYFTKAGFRGYTGDKVA